MPDVELEENTKQSFLRQQFFTVTTFSKFITAIIFIAAPFAGFYFGTQFHTEEYSAPEVVTEQVFVTEPESENHWYLYRHPSGFSVMVPKKLSLIEKEASISITKDERASSTGYTIYYRENLENETEAIKFARDIYGADCDIKIKAQGDYVVEYYVFEPNMDMMPDERPLSDCSALKVSFEYNTITKLALTWHRGLDYLLPMYDADWAGWDVGDGWYDEVNHYDFSILDSIRFTY